MSTFNPGIAQSILGGMSQGTNAFRAGTDAAQRRRSLDQNQQRIDFQQQQEAGDLALQQAQMQMQAAALQQEMDALATFTAQDAGLTFDIARLGELNPLASPGFTSAFAAASPQARQHALDALAVTRANAMTERRRQEKYQETLRLIDEFPGTERQKEDMRARATMELRGIDPDAIMAPQQTSADTVGQRQMLLGALDDLRRQRRELQSLGEDTSELDAEIFDMENQAREQFGLPTREPTGSQQRRMQRAGMVSALEEAGIRAEAGAPLPIGVVTPEDPDYDPNQAAKGFMAIRFPGGTAHIQPPQSPDEAAEAAAFAVGADFAEANPNIFARLVEDIVRAAGIGETAQAGVVVQGGPR